MTSELIPTSELLQKWLKQKHCIDEKGYMKSMTKKIRLCFIRYICENADCEYLQPIPQNVYFCTTLSKKCEFGIKCIITIKEEYHQL